MRSCGVRKSLLMFVTFIFLPTQFQSTVLAVSPIQSSVMYNLPSAQMPTSSAFGSSQVRFALPKFSGGEIQKTPPSMVVDLALVNCLDWTTPYRTNRDVLSYHPEYAELDFEGNCGDIASGKFASPFNPAVVNFLKSVVGTVSVDQAANRSVLLKARLSKSAVLGYSPVSRTRYIIQSGIDPIDIQLGGTNLEEEKLAQQWISWRLASVAGLVKSLSLIYKTKMPTGKVAVIGSADWLRMTRGQKNTTLEDWPTWASAGSIDEVVLEGDWTVPQGRTDFAASSATLAVINEKLQAASKTKRAPIKLTVLVPLRDANGRALDPLSQMLTLQGQGVRSIMLQVSDAADLPRANEFISQTLPSIKDMLQ